MRKSKRSAAACVGLGLLASASVRAGWVEDLCAEHPKRDYCIATICEKAAGQCVRAGGSGSAGGGVPVIRVQTNGNTSGGNKHEGNKDAAALARELQEKIQAGQAPRTFDSKSMRNLPAVPGRQ